MPRAYQRVTDTIFERLDLREQVFERVFFEEVRWWWSRFTDCQWIDCKFRRTLFGNNTSFSGCKFEKCRFWAQHTYLGSSRFEDCQFIDCSFKNVQMWGTEFVRCSFTGSFENLLFFGPEAPRGWQTILRDVDFSGVRMIDTDFRLGIDLGSTLMPKNL